jgi:hypothetical protein
MKPRTLAMPTARSSFAVRSADSQSEAPASM